MTKNIILNPLSYEEMEYYRTNFWSYWKAISPIHLMVYVATEEREGSTYDAINQSWRYVELPPGDLYWHIEVEHEQQRVKKSFFGLKKSHYTKTQYYRISSTCRNRSNKVEVDEAFASMTPQITLKLKELKTIMENAVALKRYGYLPGTPEYDSMVKDVIASSSV